MFEIKNKNVTVIGAARSGWAVANTVLKLGGRAKVTDAKPVAPEARVPGVTVQEGGHTQAFVRESDYVVLSPGVRQDAAPVQWARAAGIEVMGEIEFAFRLCPCPIVAITGSNGKTTTSTLTAEILTKAGRKAVLCGNIGSPFSNYVLDLKPDNIVVLEISSFQLESTTAFRPHVALWLNFSQNHLDRHKDLQEYFQAKAKIFANQTPADFALLNAAQEEFKALAKTLKAKVIFFNGPHNAGVQNPNHLAAIAAARALGVDEQLAARVCREFKGVEHRQEIVRTLEGIEYINDSKSTTPEAGRWALTHLTKPMVMICGGSDKHLDFSSLKPLVRQRVKKMVVIGQTKEQLLRTFADIVPVEACASFPEAVEAARRSAGPGDCVVLSPMCASFDMFNDYEHRGRVFKEIVQGLQ